MSALITQLVSDEPTIVALGSGLTFEAELWMDLRRAGTEVTTVSISTLVQQPQSLTQQLTNCYKIICTIKPSLLSQVELQAVIQALQLHQKKTVLVVLVDSAVQQTVPEPEVMTQWRVASDAQEWAVRTINKQLDSARMIFCQDVCQSGQREMLPAFSWLVTDAIELVDPQLLLAPTGAGELISALTEQLVLPLPQPSILMRGNSVSTTSVLREVVEAMKRVSLRTTTIRPIQGTLRPMLPFSVQEQVLHSSSSVLTKLAEWLAALVPQLPQPKPVISSNPVQLEQVQRQVLRTPPMSVSVVSEKPLQLPPHETPEEQEKRAIVQETQQTPMVVHKKTHTLLRTPTKKIDVSAELQKIFTQERVEATVERVVSIAKSEQTTQEKGKRKRVLFAGGLLAIAVGLLVFSLAGIYATSVLTLKRSLEITLSQPALLQNAVQSNDEKVYLPSPILTKIVAVQAATYGGFFETGLTVHAQQYVEVATLLPQAVAELETTQNATKALYAMVMGNEPGDVEQLSKQLTTAAQNSYEQLSKLQAILKTVELSVSPIADDNTSSEQILAENSRSQPFEQVLSKVRKTLVLQQQLHDLLPQLLGEPTKRTYAVIFQNSQELRPTGGFIQSVALLTFANGSLVNTEVLSSYELDRKLLGTVQPPEEVERYLGEKQWFLRDSNWDPNFPSSASKIAWFIDRTHGVQVDGVVAVSLESLKPVLEALGPIDLPEYNEIITHKNIDERMEFHSEVLLAPETTERDYTTVLFEKILAKTTELPAESTIPLLASVQEMLVSQEMSIALLDESEAALLDSIGWSGSLVRPNCPVQLAQPDCLVDYLYPVEANVGVNKANAYIARSVEHEITFEPSATMHTHVVRLENTARSNSWPKGTYKNYLRLYAPLGSEVKTVLLNGETIPTSQVNQYDEQGLRVVGLEVSVPIQQQAELQVVYAVPQAQQGAFSYAFFLQKQPGIGTTPTTVRVHVPEEMQAVRIAPAADVSSGMIEFSLKQSEHAFVGVDFQ